MATRYPLVFNSGAAVPVQELQVGDIFAVTGISETYTDLSTGTAIDLSKGSFFSKTISAATTFTISNVPASGFVGSFILELTNAGAYTITWWASIKWQGGVAPTLTSSGRDVLGFYTRDGGTTWNGILMSKDIK